MNWLAPDEMRALGLALLHFLWQGAAGAALLAVLLTICRRATLRYALAVLTLALMLGAPVVTFFVIRHADSGAVAVSGESSSLAAPTIAPAVVDVSPAPQPAPARRDRWLLEAWFAGVALFSLRAAGGFLVLERLRRRDATPVCARLQDICGALQRRMGISRGIRYCESRLLHVPAVIGWFRPVVLVPLTALTGLSAQQLELVIAHELAHVRRFDAVVNVFQVGVETLLFYHPAVWWVSRRIRSERENCCDDAAVALCGGHVEYARALTLMEEWRARPRLAMALNGSPLARRVVRLLGVERAGGGLRSAGTLAALLCLAVALGAGDALLGARSTFAAADAQNFTVQSVQETPARGERQLQVRPGGPQGGVAGGVQGGVVGGVPDGITEGTPGGVSDGVKHGVVGGVPGGVRGGISGGIVGGVRGDEAQQPDQSSSGSYIEDLHSAGLASFTVDELIAMKIHGVTPEFVRGLRQAGLPAGPGELVAFRIHQVTPEFVRDLQATGLRPTADNLVAMRIHNITPAYVRALQAVGPRNAGPDFFVSARVMGITQAMAETARSRGLQNLDLEKLRALQDANTI